MEVQCPICGTCFPSSEIEFHAEECIQRSFGSQTPDGKRKYSDSQEENSAREIPSSPSCSGELPSPSTSSKKSRKEQVDAWSFLRDSSQNASPKKRRDLKGRLAMTEEASQRPRMPAVREKVHVASSQHSAQNSGNNNGVPLAEKMRPVTLDDYIGQESILSSSSFLRTLIMQENFISMILWGPPGCGKTTLGNIIRQRCLGSDKWRYTSLSACTSGVQDVKNAVKEAQGALQMSKKRTVLFMDEVHRFNKSQQDVFLPHVESGLLTLVGATTENPSFTLNSALLSRCRVLTLGALSSSNIEKIIERALDSMKIGVEREGVKTGTAISSERDIFDSNEDDLEFEEAGSGAQRMVKISQEAVHWLSEMSGGDARCALSTLQILVESHLSGLITVNDAKEALQRSHVLYDRNGDEHYNFASALQKSIRGGNDNAALYWTMRMIKGGEDPRFIARRLVRTASEDIGLGTPEALTYAVSTMQAVQMLGMPESDVILAQCAVYLARAQHNPEVYLAMRRVSEHINCHSGQLPPVPLHLRNASSKLMKDLGYGRGYSHDPRKVRDIEYMPDCLRNLNFFNS